MNAGAMGAQTFENVVQRPVISMAKGMRTTKTRAEMEVYYRHVPTVRDELCDLGGIFKGTPAPREKSRSDWRNRRKNDGHLNPRPRAPAVFSRIRAAFPPGNWWKSSG